MVTLIACLSSGKGTWKEVATLISKGTWDKVFLITNQFGKDNFNAPANTSLIVVDPQKKVVDLVKDIKAELKVDDFEVALNISSGSGNEHMAVLEAVLELGLNFRLVSGTHGKVDVLGMERN